MTDDDHHHAHAKSSFLTTEKWFTGAKHWIDYQHALVRFISRIFADNVVMEEAEAEARSIFLSHYQKHIHHFLLSFLSFFMFIFFFFFFFLLLPCINEDKWL